jgi:3-dehydroquinate synthase
MDIDFQVNFTHRLRFTRGWIEASNTTLLDVMPGVSGRAAKCVFFVDEHFAKANRSVIKDIESYVSAHSDKLTMTSSIEMVPGGEDAKNAPRWLEEMLRRIHDAAICRQSYVVVIGGGAVLDSVGLAAALAHRGVRLIRIPTTTLAQADSGVGVKNGINGFGKKNYMGSFAVPWAVINDEQVLETLSERDWRSGFIEAVKVACIKDGAFFDQIESDVQKIAARDLSVAMPVIETSAKWHLKHITQSGDPFEMTTARPLDFGHWAAHKLEQMTWFRLRHGEAVAIGLALDVTYSAMMGILPQADADRIIAVLEGLGFTLWDQAMDQTEELMQGLEEFREHLGGELTITLLNAIGQPVDVHVIDETVMLAAIEHLGSGAGARTASQGIG